DIVLEGLEVGMKIVARVQDQDQVDIGWLVFRGHEAPIHDDGNDQPGGPRFSQEFGQFREERETPIRPLETPEEIADLFPRSLVNPWGKSPLSFKSGIGIATFHRRSPALRLNGPVRSAHSTMTLMPSSVSFTR